MKKKIIISIAALLIICIGFIAWKCFGPSVAVPSGEFFYVKTGSTVSDIKKDLVQKNYISNDRWFSLAARVLRFKQAKPGRYKIRKGMNIFSLVRLLRNGNQSPVSFVITKIRTREDLAKKAGNLLECDSLQIAAFINNNDSLQQFGLDTNTVIAAFMPFTYKTNWNTTAGKLFRQCYTAYRNFWTAGRKQKADSLLLTPLQVSILASIVEEETLKKTDKGNIASTYINRLRIGMPLQADPTVKFALRNFGLKRILNIHLEAVSPYNTYLHTGLPPGPICTASIETIEAVLDAPKTNYLYFVASSNFDGSSVFTNTYGEHLVVARAYQQALTKRMDSLKKINDSLNKINRK